MNYWQAALRRDETLTNQPEAVKVESSYLGRTPKPRVIPLSLTVLAVIKKIRSAWLWIERKRVLQLTSRRLHVAETISLGDKRFVSIIQVDDAQYLIGGSATNVQLLTCLEPVASQPERTPPHQPESTR